MAERKGIKVSPDIHHEIDMESTRLRVPMYSLVESIWSMYKEKKASGRSIVVEEVAAQSTSAYPPAHLSAHDKLEGILKHGSKEQIRIICKMLDSIEEDVRERHAKKEKVG